MSKNFLVVRIKGGLGNQLFCYAAARRLAIVNDAELVIDDVTGFIRDYAFQRKYSLEHFHIPCRKATARERLEPLERYRRGLFKWVSGKQQFDTRSYLEQEGAAFEPRLLTRPVKGTLYLDGYWHSEDYFKDVEDIIRRDLRIIPPQDAENQQIAQRIARTANSVALHVRWFTDPSDASGHNLSEDYYHRAVALMEDKLGSPHYFLFSDNPDAARQKLNLAADRITYVTHNQGDENAYADLWLMSQCQHFIMANSTFSWWGAWLGTNTSNNIIVTSSVQQSGISSWGFPHLIPDTWLKV
jgi:Glycosyl transferase family 11